MMLSSTFNSLRSRSAAMKRSSLNPVSLTVFIVVLIALTAMPAIPGIARAASSLNHIEGAGKSITGDGEHYLGCLPPKVLPGKVKYQQKVAAVLPPSVDLSASLPPVKSQGKQGSCTAWSTTYYCKTWLEKQEHSSWDLTDETHQFSPAWTYNQINDGGIDSGSYIYDALNLIYQRGAVDLAEMPYSDKDTKTRPSQQQYEAAKPFRNRSDFSAFWLHDDYGPYEAPNNIGPAKTWLANGKPFIIGVPIYNDFPDKGGTPPAHYYVYDGKSSLLGGHAMCVVGYDDNVNPAGTDADRRGGFLVVNSWGPTWNGADAGFVYLSYDFIKRYCSEGWCMEDLQDDSPGLTGISADRANPTALLTLTGNNFGSLRRAASVNFNGTDATFAVFSNDTILAEVPEGATSGNVTVYDWEGTSAGSLPLTIGGLPATSPKINSFAPGSSCTNREFSMSITGSGFSPGCQAYLKLAASYWPENNSCLPLKNAKFTENTGIEGTVDPRRMPSGYYDIFVTNPDSTSYNYSYIALNDPVDTYEPNGTIESAYGFLESGTDYYSFTSMNTDDDYYKIMVPERTRSLEVKLGDVPLACHPTLILCDSNGDPLAESELQCSSNSAGISLDNPPPGIYYIGVLQSFNYDNADPYKLRFTTDVDAPTWYMPEGCTAEGFETWICMENVNDEDANVGMTYHTGDGTVSGPSFKVPARSRKTVNLADNAGSLMEVATVVTADREISVERSTYWNGRSGGHASTAALDKATEWHLPEGSTGGSFETWILLLNPGTTAANVKLSFCTENGKKEGPSITVPPGTRKTVNAAEFAPGMWSVATEVESNVPVVAERAMYWDTRKAGHASMGSRFKDTEWELAEGSTGGSFETWVCIENPGEEETGVKIEYLTENGKVNGPEFTMKPYSRRSVNAAETVPGVWSVSTHIESDKPVVAERAMYWNNRTGGHASLGSTSPSATWSVPEGCTAGGFETWILVENPGDSDAVVHLWYLTDGKTISGSEAVIKAESRATFNVGDSVPGNFNVSTEVTCNRPVVVERAMYWNGRREGHSSAGVAGTE